MSRIFCELPPDCTAAEALAVLSVQHLVRRHYPDVREFYRADVPNDFDMRGPVVAPKSRIAKWLYRRKLNRMTYQTITVTTEYLVADDGPWFVLKPSRSHDRRPWKWRLRLVRWWMFE